MKRLFSLDISKIKNFIRHNTITLDYGGGMSFVGSQDFYYRINNGSWVKINANTYSTIVLFIKTYIDADGVYRVSNMDISNGDTAGRTIIQDIITSQRVDLMGEWDDTYFDYRFSEWFEKNMIIIDNPIEIQLSYIAEPENYMSKTPSDVISIYGALRDEIDVINPVILIETDSTITLTNKNYASFTILGKLRYYFIRNITCVRTNVYRLTLHQDMLMSFGSLILKTPVFVTRSEGDGGGIGLVDDRLPLKDRIFVEYVNASPNDDTSVISLKTTFDENDLTITASTISNAATNTYYTALIDDSYVESTFSSLVAEVTPFKFKNPLSVTYILNYHKFTELVDLIKNQSSLEGYMLSAVSWPFYVSDDCLYDVDDETTIFLTLALNQTPVEVSVGVWETASVTKGDVGDFKCVGKLKIDSQNVSNMISSNDTRYYFLNYEPYSQYDLFIPYCGWIKLNAVDIVGNTIRIYYIPDYVTGLASVNVWVSETQRIIYTSTIQLGTPLGVTRTNQEELIKQKQANATSLALGLISSAAAVGIGIATVNPLTAAGGIIGGVMGGASSIANFINKNNMMLPNSSTRAGGESFDLFNGNKCILKHSYREPVFAENSTADDIYLRANGLPLNSGETIESFSSGYIECASVELPFEETISGTTYTLLKDEYDEIVSLLKSGIVI